MTTTGRTTESLAAVESADFVRIVTRADGDALAAAGVLARGLAARETPFQVSVASTLAERTERANATRGNSSHDATPEADAADGARPTTEPTVVIGPSNADAHRVERAGRPASIAACELVRDLGETPDPILGLAGAFAAGVAPEAETVAWLLDAARERGGVERRPGVAIPTADPVDGLAHSTLVRAPWSGDGEAVREAIGGVETRTDEPVPDDEPETGAKPETDDESGSDDEPRTDDGRLTDDDRRAIGSLVALDAVGDAAASPRSAGAVARVVHPYATPDGPFATIGGYADVLEAAARTDPGTGVALAIGHDVRESALAAWRTHGRRVHRGLETASTGRYDGLFVLGVEDEADDRRRGSGVLETVARLAAAYRSPEPVVLALGDGAAGLAAVDESTNGAPVDERESLAAALETVAETIDAEFDYGPRTGSLRYDPSVEDGTVIEAVRGAL